MREVSEQSVRVTEGRGERKGRGRGEGGGRGEEGMR